MPDSMLPWPPIDLNWQMSFQGRLRPLKGCVEWGDKDLLQSSHMEHRMIFVELYGMSSTPTSLLRVGSLTCNLENPGTPLTQILTQILYISLAVLTATCLEIPDRPDSKSPSSVIFWFVVQAVVMRVCGWGCWALLLIFWYKWMVQPGYPLSWIGAWVPALTGPPTLHFCTLIPHLVLTLKTHELIKFVE